MKTTTIFLLLLAMILCCPAYCAEIHDAAKAGDLEKVKALLAKGADVNAKDDHDMTPLHWAKVRDNQPLIELLRKHGAKE